MLLSQVEFMIRCMELRITDLAHLPHSAHLALEVLLKESFPGDDEIIGVELARATDQRSGRCLVALHGREVVGAVLYRPPRYGSIFVVYLAVAPAWRRQRLASRLLDAITEVERAGRLELLVRRDNLAATALYRRGGLIPEVDPDLPSKAAVVRHVAVSHRAQVRSLLVAA
jgi:ribosomal protein S18 acetylase RimI-like enzyme